MDKLEAKNATLVVLSVDSVKQSAETRQRLKLSYPLYSDGGGKVVRGYDILQDGMESSWPATFVVDKGGKVLFQRVGEHKRDRPITTDILTSVP